MYVQSIIIRNKEEQNIDETIKLIESEYKDISLASDHIILINNYDRFPGVQFVMTTIKRFFWGHYKLSVVTTASSQTLHQTLTAKWMITKFIVGYILQQTQLLWLNRRRSLQTTWQLFYLMHLHLFLESTVDIHSIGIDSYRGRGSRFKGSGWNQVQVPYVYAK